MTQQNYSDKSQDINIELFNTRIDRINPLVELINRSCDNSTVTNMPGGLRNRLGF